MTSDNVNLEVYGLQDPDVLEVAIELAPALFAALDISNKLPESTYPLASNLELEETFRQIATAEDQYEGPGISITAKDSRDKFPGEFLPITDRLDLLRKLYMAIVIAREAAAERGIAAAKSGSVQVEASHPFKVGDL